MPPVPRRRRLTTSIAALLCALVAGQTAVACAFHTYTPNPTLIDRLYDSEQVVLARPDPGAPQRLVPFAALAGELEYVDLPPGLSAETARALRGTRDAALLFARDGAYGPWLQLAVLDPAQRDVVDTALARRDDWERGTGLDRQRYFARQLASPSPGVRRLALLELDRLDYDALRSLGPRPGAAVTADVAAGDPDLRPIRVLLAGLSGDPAVRAPLEAGFAEAVARDLRYLGAYATALIELDRGDAVRRLVAAPLSNAALRPDTAEKIIEAFAIHDDGRDIVAAVEGGLAQLLDRRPELAGAVARQFLRHGNWHAAQAVRVAADRPGTGGLRDRVSVAKYLAAAERGAPRRRTPAPGPTISR